jgi:hypothetical protein
MASGESLWRNRQRNEFAHADVHGLHQQMRINHLAHQEKMDLRILPRQRGDAPQQLAADWDRD